MSKVLIVSDTHGNQRLLRTVLNNNQDCKYLIHLGDEPEDLERYQKLIEDMQVFYVFGMYHQRLTDENIRKCFQIEDVNFVISHCKDYLEIEQKQCIYCFGHTHRAFFENKDGIVLLNPGHLKANVDRNETAGYVVIDIANTITVVFYTYDGRISLTQVVSW